MPVLFSSSIPIDYNLYRKFWTLQDYFRNPVQCYDKFSWITFVKVRIQSPVPPCTPPAPLNTGVCVCCVGICQGCPD